MAEELAVQELGERDEGAATPPLAVLHGILGSSRNWQGLGKSFAKKRPVLLVDQRNHGNSPWSPEMDYAAMAGDLEALLDTRKIEQADIIGHSMGGKTAMRFALEHRERVRRLVIVDIAPVDYGRGQGFHGYIEAMRAIDVESLERRGEADKALAEAVPEASIRAFLLQNLESRKDAPGLRWKPNLEVLLEALPRLTGWPEAELGGRTWTGPALFIEGSESDYIDDRSWPMVEEHFPNARLARIDGASHWVHAQKPREFASMVEDFLGD